MAPQGQGGTQVNFLRNLFRYSLKLARLIFLPFEVLSRFIPIRQFLSGFGIPRQLRDTIPNFREEFEASYGNVHPQFVDGSYKNAMRIAAREFK